MAKLKSKNRLKSYEVIIQASATVVVVDAENEQKAIEYAEQEISRGDFEIDESSVDRVLTTAKEIEDAKRWAQAVALPDDPNPQQT